MQYQCRVTAGGLDVLLLQLWRGQLYMCCSLVPGVHRCETFVTMTRRTLHSVASVP